MALNVPIITVLAVALVAIVAPNCNIVSKTAVQSLFGATRPIIFLPVTLFSGTKNLDRKAHVSRVVSEYEIRTIIKEKPKFRPAKMSLTVMSFIVKDEHLSEDISNSIIDCLATETSTKPSNWGLYNADQFAASMIQVEFFAFVNTQNVARFSAAVTAYAIERQLAWCVRSKVPSFGPDADIICGHRVTEVVPNRLRHFWSAPSALELALIASHLLICATLFCVAVWVRKNRISVVCEGRESVIRHDVVFKYGYADVLQSELNALACSWRFLVDRHWG